MNFKINSRRDTGNWRQKNKTKYKDRIPDDFNIQERQNEY